MIHKGERNKEGKIKQIYKLNEWQRKFNKELAKRYYILFVCSECGLQISYQPTTENNKNERLDYDYDDYLVWFKDNSDFRHFKNNYKHTNYTHWGGAEKMCIDCGCDFSNEDNIEKKCRKCNSRNIISGNELYNKPCPICGTKFQNGIEFNGYNAYTKKKDELEDIWWNIYRERYNVSKPQPKDLTEQEKNDLDRCKLLTECYQQNDFFVIGNPNNVIRFEFKDAWHSGFCCILEWENNKKGKLTLFKNFSWDLIEKSINFDEIQQVIDILKKYNYFEKKFYKKTFGFDGWTFGMEVKIDDKYKELAIWGVERGILYDIGMLLLKFGEKSFKDYYEYAW